jgi:hypothetical protein
MASTWKRRASGHFTDRALSPSTRLVLLHFAAALRRRCARCLVQARRDPYTTRPVRGRTRPRLVLRKLRTVACPGLSGIGCVRAESGQLRHTAAVGSRARHDCVVDLLPASLCSRRAPVREHKLIESAGVPKRQRQPVAQGRTAQPNTRTSHAASSRRPARSGACRVRYGAGPRRSRQSPVVE